MRKKVFTSALTAILFALLPLLATAQSTSPSKNGANNQAQGAKLAPENAITFSEFPLGTSISTQYQDEGIIFGGSAPFISTDGANPTSPVLSGTPRFQGSITGTFVEPGTNEPTVVESFTFDAGFFDEIGSTRVEWFDPDDNKLGQRINSRLGIEPLTMEGGNIASWEIEIVENEPAGFAIDNVSFTPIGPSILFREKADGEKDGTWGLSDDAIPGFDHVGFHIANEVYESHPGYPDGTYVSADGQETASINSEFGVQAQHTLATFRHDNTTTGSTPVIDFEEIPIDESLANGMRTAIESVSGADFQGIDYSLDGLEATLSPTEQKGGGNSFTCVGLIEWAAEQAGRNGGQGFINNSFESFTVPDPRLDNLGETIEVPLLSPQLLNYALKGGNLLENSKQYVQGLFDPVDFIVTDPLGRQLGFTQGRGSINEIPNAFYSGDGGVEQIFIPNAIPGAYEIEFVGTGEEVFAAVSAFGSSESISRSLASGESVKTSLSVDPRVGSGGDVDEDGDIDLDDINSLQSLLNTFTEGLGHPGDLDGDGLLSNQDLDLLAELVGVLDQGCSEAQISDFSSTPDDGEYIEITNTGSDPISLTECATLVFFDGADSESYFATDLVGTIQANSSFLIGNRDVDGIDQSFPNGTLQNGPDAIALYEAEASDFPDGTATSQKLDDLFSSIVYVSDQNIFGCQNASVSGCSNKAAGESVLLRLSELVKRQQGPEQFTLNQGFPNPFSDQITISYALPKQTKVELVVYDVRGREVQRLVDGTRRAGRHEVTWNGRDAGGQPVSSGVYFYRLKAGDFVDTRSVQLVR